MAQLVSTRYSMPRTVLAENLRKGDVLTGGQRLRADAVTWKDTDGVVLPIAGTHHDYCGGENIGALRTDPFQVERFGWEA